jgi:hypothetical protein
LELQEAFAMKRTAGAVLIVATLIPIGADAQAAAGSLGDLQKLVKPGQIIVVTDAMGRDTKGKFVAVLGDSLVLSIPEERRFREETIAKVKRYDPVWNGAVIGGLVLGIWCARICGQGLDSRQQLLPVVAANAGFGALIGAGMDALERPQTLYLGNTGFAGLGTDGPPKGGHYAGRYGVSFSVRY